MLNTDTFFIEAEYNGEEKVGKMKIILAALNAKYVHSNLAIRYLKREIEDEFDVELYESTINEDVLNIAFDILNKNPDVVAFSCYIWNIENTIKVVNAIKNVNNKINIILGGPEVSFDSEELLKKYNYVDFIIRGEGERIIKPLMYAISKNALQELNNLKGVAYRYENKIIDTGYADTIKDLDTIKFPYQNEIPDKIVYYEASRGCPFRCSYCMSSIDKRVRYRNIEIVKKELKHLIDAGVKLVKFVDRTFNSNKKFSRDIWEYLINLNPSTSFHFEIAADLLDDEDIEILSKAPLGLFQFEIGVQSTNTEVLKHINRVMDFERVRKNVKKIIEIGNIHCHLDLIVGLPTEDINSFKKSFNDVLDIKPDELQIGFLKVLKGSPISTKKQEYGIKHVDYPPYHVLSTNEIDFTQVQYLINFEKVFDIYYNSHIFDNTMKFIFKQQIDYFDFFKELTDMLYKNSFFERNVGLSDRFKYLYEFLIVKYETNVVKDLLIYDYLKTTKKSNLPDFLKKEFDAEYNRKLEKNKENILKNSI